MHRLPRDSLVGAEDVGCLFRQFILLVGSLTAKYELPNYYMLFNWHQVVSQCAAKCFFHQREQEYSVLWRRYSATFSVRRLYRSTAERFLPAEKLIAQANSAPHCEFVVSRAGIKMSRPYMISKTNARTDKQTVK